MVNHPGNFASGILSIIKMPLWVAEIRSRIEMIDWLWLAKMPSRHHEPEEGES
jgi:hypothetical protein